MQFQFTLPSYLCPVNRNRRSRGACVFCTIWDRIIDLPMIRILGTVFARLRGWPSAAFLNVCVSRWPEARAIVSPRFALPELGRRWRGGERAAVSCAGLRGRCRTLAGTGLDGDIRCANWPVACHVDLYCMAFFDALNRSETAFLLQLPESSHRRAAPPAHQRHSSHTPASTGTRGLIPMLSSSARRLTPTRSEAAEGQPASAANTCPRDANHWKDELVPRSQLRAETHAHVCRYRLRLNMAKVQLSKW